MLEYRATSDNDSGVICGVIALPHAVVYIPDTYVLTLDKSYKKRFPN